MHSVTNSCFQVMLNHLRAVYPEEGCGFLAGVSGRATHHYPVTNADHSATTFIMDAYEQVTAMLAIEAQALEVVAIYHSHPHSPPYPSPTDIGHANYPDVAQIIVSLSDVTQPLVKGFYIQDGRIIPVNITVEQ